MFNIRNAIKLLILLSLPNMAGAAFKYWDVAFGDSIKDPNDTLKKIVNIPPTLSALGMYVDITAAKKVTMTGIYHFDVNSALWSDDAHKNRFFLLRPGKSIGFELTNDYWKYPDSTVFLKNFAIDTIIGDTTSRVLWETRVLINKKESVVSSEGKTRMDERWYGLSYKWNPDQKDARLVLKNGMDDSIRVHNGVGQPGYMKKWHFPSRRECNQCHRAEFSDTIHGRSVLGFFTAQLNRPHPDFPTMNQLEYFFTNNLLTGTKPAEWNAVGVPKWAGIEDASASVDIRARSYIAANCSGCHGTRGMANSATFGVNLNYDFHTMESQMEFRQRGVSWPFSLDTVPPFYYRKTDLVANPLAKDSLYIEPALVIPGYPSKSVILFRQMSRNTKPGNYDFIRTQMPPLGSFQVNQKSAALITRWIMEMEPIEAPHATAGILHRLGRSEILSPVIEGHILRLPTELASIGNVRVTLTGISGRSMELTQTGNGNYAIPYFMSPGIYMIRVNGKSYRGYLF